MLLAESSFTCPFPTCRSIGDSYVYIHIVELSIFVCSSNGLFFSYLYAPIWNAITRNPHQHAVSRISRRMRSDIDRFAPGRAWFEIRMPFKWSLTMVHSSTKITRRRDMVRSFRYIVPFREFSNKMFGGMAEWMGPTRQHGGKLALLWKCHVESAFIFTSKYRYIEKIIYFCSLIPQAS